MAIKTQEKQAMIKKAENPEKEILCPRCGKALGYRAVGTSYEVKCPTNGCIKMAVRGI